MPISRVALEKLRDSCGFCFDVGLEAKRKKVEAKKKATEETAKKAEEERLETERKKVEAGKKAQEEAAHGHAAEHPELGELK